MMQYETWLHARVPRTYCSKHGVKQVDLPWARPGSGFTLHIEAMVLAMADEMSVAALAEHIGMNEDSVWRILKHYVDQCREDTDLSGITMLAVDEFAVKKGHKYVTMFYDVEGRRVIHIAEGKGAETFDDFVQAMHGRLDLAKVQVVCMDMSRAFISACKRVFPGTAIVFDHFHIIKLVNDVVNRIRIAEARESDHLVKTKYCWLKNPENLTEKQEERLNGIKDLDLLTAQAYHLRLAIQRLWTLPRKQAKAYLGKWIGWARKSRSPQMVDLAETMASHSDGIIASISLGLSSGFAEGLNTKIRAAFRRAFGFKAKEYRDTMIYMTAGGLVLPTPC
jgi:transposase